MEFFQPKSMRAGASSAAGLLAALGCLLLAGCNNGKQLHRDLITRELRLQEDEIYRLEDYLEEYQRKVCELRKQNQDLRQQLGENVGSRPSNGRESYAEPDGERSLLDLPPDPAPRGDSGAESDERFVPPDLPTIDFGTPVDAPAAPEFDPPPPAVTLPEEGETEENEAPPFKPSTAPPSPAPTPQVEEASPISNTQPIPEEMLLPPPAALEPLSFDVGDDPLQPIAELEPSAPPAPTAPPVAQIAIHSTTGAPEPNGQTTLLVKVTPMSADGGHVEFKGQASLMLRQPVDEGREPPLGSVKLARWDYQPDELLLARESTAADGGLEFLIALPAETPTGRPLELWVRLVDEQGNKTLGQAAVAIKAPLEPSPPSQVAQTLEPRLKVVRQVEETQPETAPHEVEPASWTTPAPSPQAMPELLQPKPVGFTPPTWRTPLPKRKTPASSDQRGAGADPPRRQPAPRLKPKPRIPPNPWQQQGRDANAPRLVDGGISFEP